MKKLIKEKTDIIYQENKQLKSELELMKEKMASLENQLSKMIFAKENTDYEPKRKCVLDEME
jgi:cell division septum initiation protein DivIVA